MTVYYPPEHVLMFRSRIDVDVFFSTADEARARDTSTAYAILRDLRLDRLHDAFRRHDDRLHAALKFLAEETDVFPDFDVRPA